MWINKTGLRRSDRQRGASAVEYIVGLVAVVGVLLTPLPPNSKNVITLLEEAIKKEHSAYVYGSAVQRMPDKKRKK